MLPVLLLDFPFMPGWCLNTHFPFCLISFDRYILQPSSLWKDFCSAWEGWWAKQMVQVRQMVSCETENRPITAEVPICSVGFLTPETRGNCYSAPQFPLIKSLRDFCNFFHGILLVSEAKYLMLKSLPKLFLTFQQDQIHNLFSKNSLCLLLHLCILLET